MSLYKKLLIAQKAIGYVAKNGQNRSQNYDYATEADILQVVKRAVNDAGLVILTSATSEIGNFEAIDAKGGRYICRWAKVTLNYKIVDAETGEVDLGSFDGYAEDKGDKAVYKATTGANKYFLMKMFGVATGDDPEQECQAPEKNVAESKPQQQPQKNTAPATDLEKHRAKVVAGEITKLQKQHKLSDEDVRRLTQIRSLRGLVSVGGVATLEGGLQRMRAAL